VRSDVTLYILLVLVHMSTILHISYDIMLYSLIYAYAYVMVVLLCVALLIILYSVVHT